MSPKLSTYFAHGCTAFTYLPLSVCRLYDCRIHLSTATATTCSGLLLSADRWRLAAAAQPNGSSGVWIVLRAEKQERYETSSQGRSVGTIYTPSRPRTRYESSLPIVPGRTFSYLSCFSALRTIQTPLLTALSSKLASGYIRDTSAFSVTYVLLMCY